MPHFKSLLRLLASMRFHTEAVHRGAAGPVVPLCNKLRAPEILPWSGSVRGECSRLGDRNPILTSEAHILHSGCMGVGLR